MLLPVGESTYGIGDIASRRVTGSQTREHSSLSSAEQQALIGLPANVRGIWADRHRARGQQAIAVLLDV